MDRDSPAAPLPQARGRPPLTKQGSPQVRALRPFLWSWGHYWRIVGAPEGGRQAGQELRLG